jgi:hypothetical protein
MPMAGSVLRDPLLVATIPQHGEDHTPARGVTAGPSRRGI